MSDNEKLAKKWLDTRVLLPDGEDDLDSLTALLDRVADENRLKFLDDGFAGVVAEARDAEREHVVREVQGTKTLRRDEILKRMGRT